MTRWTEAKVATVRLTRNALGRDHHGQTRTKRSDSKRRVLSGSARLLAGALRGRNHFAHQGQFGQRPDRRIELERDIALKRRKLNEVAESLLAEINAVRIDDEFDRA